MLILSPRPSSDSVTAVEAAAAASRAGWLSAVPGGLGGAGLGGAGPVVAVGEVLGFGAAGVVVDGVPCAGDGLGRGLAVPGCRVPGLGVAPACARRTDTSLFLLSSSGRGGSCISVNDGGSSPQV